MRISKFKLNNYVCFYDEEAEDVELRPEINFIVGKNNSGKTSLLDAILIDTSRTSHRSVETMSERDTNVLNTMTFEVEYEFCAGDLLTSLLKYDVTDIAVAEGDHELSISEHFKYFKRALHEATNLRICVDRDRVFVRYSGIEFDVTLIEYQRYYRLALGDDNSLQISSTSTHPDPDGLPQNCWKILIQCLLDSVFRFNAERMVQRHSSTQNDLILKPDASNLAQVLDTATRERTYEFEKLVDHAKNIFPAIREIVPRKLPDVSDGSEKLEIYVGYYDRSLRRDDLRVPLSGCGSGIAQVLAMLYVAVVSAYPSTIIIDEPHSFLHPEAVRKLFEIFQLPAYRHHQYILTTHSPTALASVQDKSILLLERENMKSCITPINPSKQADLELTLRTVGARLSDVFGMDSIIWVEGETDEVCFPMILRAHNVPLFGTKVLRLAHTGDFTDKKYGVTSINLYKRLCAGEALLPPALAFVFDADLESGLERVKAEFGQQVRFLCRQNYESYVLDAAAITCVLKEDDPDNANEYSQETIQNWIDQNHITEDYYAINEFDAEKWLFCIDGAKLIANLFGKVSDHRVEYRKTRHTPWLTRLILADNPNHFQEIVDLITSILEKDKQADST